MVPSCLGEQLQGAGVRDRGVAWRGKDPPWPTLTLWPRTLTEPYFCFVFVFFGPVRCSSPSPCALPLLLCGTGAPAASAPASLCEVILAVSSCRFFFFFFFFFAIEF